MRERETLGFACTNFAVQTRRFGLMKCFFNIRLKNDFISPERRVRTAKFVQAKPSVFLTCIAIYRREKLLIFPILRATHEIENLKRFRLRVIYDRREEDIKDLMYTGKRLEIL